MNTQFVQLNECWIVQYVRMSLSIQRLPDESVVIISGTIVEVVISNTEWSWAVKSELCKKLIWDLSKYHRYVMV